MVSSSSLPSYQSAANTGKHADPVWRVNWAKDNLDGYMNFYSCSGDGRVTNWTIVKTSLWFSDLLLVNFNKKLKNFKTEVPLTDGVRALAFKPDDDALYLIGTEEGDIHLVSTEYSTAFLMTYTAHITPVNNLVWNEFYPSLFLSCASEQTVYLWHKDIAKPILSYDVGVTVNDVSWAPYSSTVFALVTADGSVRVFDIHLNKYRQICKQVSLM